MSNVIIGFNGNVGSLKVWLSLLLTTWGMTRSTFKGRMKKSCTYGKKGKSTIEEHGTFLNGAVDIAFDKFGDTEKGIISIEKFENILDEIKTVFYCDEFDIHALIVDPNLTGYID